MAVSAPTSRSDISKLREEKKRREEEARRKSQEAEAAKAKAGERKPSIGYPEPKNEEPSGPIMPRAKDGDPSGDDLAWPPSWRQAEYKRMASELAPAAQFAKGVGGSLLDAAKKGVQGARDEARAAGDSRRRAAESSKNLEEGPFSESGQQARREADALRNFDYRGAGAALSEIGGNLLGGLSGVLPGMPRVDTRSNEQKQSDADGVFSDDYDRRQEAKEIQAEVDAEDYADAYDQYVQKARARGDNENTIMSPEEFVDEMSGTQQSEDGLGRERVGPMVGAHEVRRNVGSFQERQERPDGQSRYLPGDTPLDLDGEVFMPNNQGDSDNAGRIRDIVGERKRRNPDEPIPVGMQAQVQSTQRDPYSGAPMTEGSGKLVAPSLNSDGSVGAKTYTRAIPPEIESAAAQLPAAERDMYIAQSMGVDLNQYPPSQRQAVAQKFVNEKRGLADRGNMVAAYTDPKTGYFVDAEGNPILDADGKPRKSDVPLAYDKDGNLLPGSEAPVFIRSEEALKRGKQRTNFNNRMQEARNSGDNLIMSFVSRDPETNKLKFDEEGFEAQYPGSLPPPGPERTKAISQLTNLIERGRAVQQNRDRLGRRQQESSPTFGPILMRESLQQAETPEEAAMIALYFNRPDIAQFYQQQAMGDRAILAEEKKAEAVANTAALRSGRNGAVDTPAGLLEQQNRVINDALADGNIAGAVAILAGEGGHMTEDQVRDQALATQAKASPAALRLPMHAPVADAEFKKVTGVFPVEAWDEESILRAEEDFKIGMARRAGLDPENPEVSKILHRMFEQFWNEEFGKNSGRTMGGQDYPRPKAQETTGVGLPDDDQPGTQPGWVGAF